MGSHSPRDHSRSEPRLHLGSDHCCGRGQVAARFDRYQLTAGYNGVINQRQFRLPNLAWPAKYRYPDETYVTEHDLDIGGMSFQLRHEKGETDDHTVTWIPSARAMCCGDLFIWASPNAGNPQKVQRYPSEWACLLYTSDAADE